MSPAPEADRAMLSRPLTYLIAHDNTIVAPASVGPVDFDWLVEQLDANPAVNVQQTLRPRSFVAQSLSTSITDQVVVAEMPEDVANDLRQHPQVVLEEDHLLLPQEPVTPPTDPGLVSPFGTSTSWTLKLVAPDGSPVSDATVYLYGSSTPAQGRTDASGSVTLSLLNESDATLRALYVNPESGYWSIWVNRPTLTSGSINTVPVQSLSASFPGFPAQQILGWGQQAMRLDQVPANMTGRGIKVAVVDSGAAKLTHPDLMSIASGVDLTTTPSNSDQWVDDTMAHGSHCSGVIAGSSNNATGIRGFAPDAEVHEARIFPGGRVSSLIDAVDYCIDQQIDVVNMSLGTGGTSQILLQKLSQAKDAGVACIVAAGNTGGEVQFPGNSPDVLTVAAIGREGTFPDSSYHAQQRWTGGTEDQNFFSAQFSCHGPEVAVAGPGVAIVSSVPPDGFASWDGTSMATPHITGLAALVLAHHPDFASGAFQIRTRARVDRLFSLIRGSATALSFGDGERSGSGLPDCLRALGLSPQANGQQANGQQANGQQANGQQANADAIATALAQLQQQIASAGLALEMAEDTPSVSGNSSDAVDRGLAELRAQLQAASLSMPQANSTHLTGPHPPSGVRTPWPWESDWVKV